jgi:DNA processing protein
MDLVTIGRLRTLLAHHDPEQAFAVASGQAAPDPTVEPMLRGEVGRAWQVSARTRDPAVWALRCRRFGIDAVTAADSRYPDVLRTDPQPPAVLFWRGDWSMLGARTVGIVGTRNATGPGCQTARRLGAELAGAGICVVSGLARGIDAAAHQGALGQEDGRTAGVVANSLDVAYPRQNAALWEAVASRGLLLSEWPPGTQPEAFRFPLRNRVIAALSEIVVVVESRERGGSLTTVREALERSIDVMAVPGSVHNRAATGTNQLLRDGAAPVTDATDVLVALGLDHRRAPGRAYDPRPLPRGTEAAVLDRCRAGPCTLEHVVEDVGLSINEAAMTLARLERSGWLHESGGWFEEVLA